MTPPRYFALVPAAGAGTRMGSAVPKQYLPLSGRPMLSHVLQVFACAPAIDHVFVVVSEDDDRIEHAVAASGSQAGRITVLRKGGASRHHTVLNGVVAMEGQAAPHDWVLVHDGARPGLSHLLIDRLIREVGDDAVGGLLAVPVVDTIKRAVDARSVATVPREALWAAQTPQMFRQGLLRQALEQAREVTDEASAIEQLGHHPRLVAGSSRNFKVTLPGDIAMAEFLMKGSE